MDVIKKKLAQLTAELDAANEARDELAAKVKVLEQENLAKEQEITSLGHQKGNLETEVEKLEGLVKEHKEKASQHSVHSDQIESLTRKNQVHEEEAEQTERQLKETYEKLRQTDVKAGHFERKVQALEQSNALLEKKLEDAQLQLKEKNDELEKFAAELGAL